MTRSASAMEDEPKLPKCGCGGETAWWKSTIGDPERISFFHRCNKCQIQTAHFPSLPQAAAAWTRAMPAAAAGEALRDAAASAQRTLDELLEDMQIAEPGTAKASQALHRLSAALHPAAAQEEGEDNR